MDKSIAGGNLDKDKKEKKHKKEKTADKEEKRIKKEDKLDKDGKKEKKEKKDKKETKEHDPGGPSTAAAHAPPPTRPSPTTLPAKVPVQTPPPAVAAGNTNDVTSLKDGKTLEKKKKKEGKEGKEKKDKDKKLKHEKKEKKAKVDPATANQAAPGTGHSAGASTPLAGASPAPATGGDDDMLGPDEDLLGPSLDLMAEDFGIPQTPTAAEPDTAPTPGMLAEEAEGDSLTLADVQRSALSTAALFPTDDTGNYAQQDALHIDRSFQEEAHYEAPVEVAAGEGNDSAMGQNEGKINTDTVPVEASEETHAIEGSNWWKEDADPDPEIGSAFKVGEKVQAKFGNSFFEAEVTEVSKTDVKIRYAYDGTESWLPLEEVKADPAAAADAQSSAHNNTAEDVHDDAAMEAGEEEAEPQEEKFDVIEVPEGLHEEAAAQVPKDGTCTVMVQQAATSMDVELTPGLTVEAKFGNAFFDAEVVEVDGETIKVKYAYDGSEAELPKEDIKPSPAAQSKPAFEVGQSVQAKFGNSFFDAEVVEKTDSVVKVKYAYDGTEAELPFDEIKAPTSDKPVTLHIYGDERARAMTRLKICKLLFENKSPGFEEKLVNDPSDVVGLTVLNITTPSKCIGTKGAMMKKIEGASGASVKILAKMPDGTVAEKPLGIICGNGEEREVAAGMLELADSGSNDNVFPESLVQKGTLLKVPSTAFKALMGEKRANFNQLEEEFKILGFTGQVPLPPYPDLDNSLFQAGAVLEASYNGQWHEAEVVEVLEGDQAKIKWGYDGSEQDLSRAELRPKLEGEALAERQRLEQEAANLKVMLLLGAAEARRAAKGRIMALVEEGKPGTYLANDGYASVALDSEDLELLRQEVAQRAAQKAAESAQWWGGDNTWNNDGKWGNQDSYSGASASASTNWDTNPSSSWDAGRSDTASSWGKRDWEQAASTWGDSSATAGDQGDYKRARVDDAPGSHGNAQEPQVQQSATELPPQPKQCNVTERIELHGQPTTLEQWTEMQGQLFEGHTPPLPPGWIRCWSRSKAMVYYVRVVDNMSVFDLNEVFASTWTQQPTPQ